MNIVLADFNPLSIIMGPLQSMLRGLIQVLANTFADLALALVEPIMMDILKILAWWGFLFIIVIVKLVIAVVAQIFIGAIAQILMVASASPAMLNHDFVLKAAGIMQTFGISIVVVVALYYGFKSFFSFFGYEADEPWKIMVRSGVALFFVLASIDICAGILYTLKVVIDIVFGAFGVANNGEVSGEALSEFAMNISGSDFNPLTMPVHIIVFIMIVKKLFTLIFKYAERYVLILILTIFSPIAFAFSVSKRGLSNFSDNWWKFYIGSMLIQVIQVAGFALLMAININGFNDFMVFDLGTALLSLGCLSLIETAETVSQGIGGLGFGNSAGNQDSFNKALIMSQSVASRGVAYASRGLSGAFSATRNALRR